MICRAPENEKIDLARQGYEAFGAGDGMSEIGRHALMRKAVEDVLRGSAAPR